MLCLLAMRLKEIMHRLRWPRAHNNDQTSVMVGPKRDIALVIAAPELAAAISELYQVYGYEVFLPETPLDVIETLAMVGDQVRVVLISSQTRWANGLRELIAADFPKADRITLVS